MNSIAQHAVTNGYGNSENLRAHPTSSSFFVERYSNACDGAFAVRIGIVFAAMLLGDLFQQPRLVDVEQHQNQQKYEDEKSEQHEAGQRLALPPPR